MESVEAKEIYEERLLRTYNYVLSGKLLKLLSCVMKKFSKLDFFIKLERSQEIDSWCLIVCSSLEEYNRIILFLEGYDAAINKDD